MLPSTDTASLSQNPLEESPRALKIPHELLLLLEAMRQLVSLHTSTKAAPQTTPAAAAEDGAAGPMDDETARLTALRTRRYSTTSVSCHISECFWVDGLLAVVLGV